MVASIIHDAGLNLLDILVNVQMFYNTLSALQGSKPGMSCQCPKVDHEMDVPGGDKDELQESDAEVGQRRSTRNATRANNDTAAQAARRTETVSHKVR